MKILRVRRGYTTNSSSSTEWLPPRPGNNANQESTTPGQTASTTPLAEGAAPSVATNHLGSNAITIVGIVGALCAAYVGERLFRKWRGSKPPVGGADDYNDES